MIKLYWPFRRALTITGKFSLLTGVSVALAAVAVELMLFRGSSHILFEQAESHLTTEANIASMILVEEIDNLSSDAVFLSNLHSVLSVLGETSTDSPQGHQNSHDKTHLVDLLVHFARSKPNYYKVRVIGVKNGGEEILAIERHGDAVYLMPGYELQNKRHRPFYQQSLRLEAGGVYLSDITLNREFGDVSQPYTPVMRASSPVYIDGELYGLIVISMAFKPVFQRIIASSPKHYSMYLTNSQGDILVNPDGSLNFAFEFDEDSSISERVPEKLWTMEATAAGGVQHFDNNQDTWLLQMVRAQFDSRSNDRFVGVFLLASEQAMLDESISLLNRNLFYLSLLVLVSMIIVGAWTRRILNPLKDVIKASDALANGDNSVSLPEMRRDEIGDLARAFEAMRRELKKKEFAVLQNQTKAMLSAKKAALGDIASGMAHEINSPIQAIQLSAERLTRKMEKGTLGEKDLVSLNKISASVSRVSGIINSLSKISRNSHNEDFQHCQVAVFITDASDLVEEKCKVNGIDFSVEYLEETDKVVIDCQRLHLAQVIVNLLNNACDAVSECDEKWIRIQISQSEQQVIIRVMDSGPGIPAKIRERIFDPMFTTKEIGKGTGLGLSISQTIIRGHGGVIRVDAQCPNTCFILTLDKEHNND
ncbi:sensor histidine kinase [Kistimonas asteriae]|uniref:sensor histidine kinase n=1 Tax=Kistimonas asteriae TaxID=517724 RepID=UPI001BAD5312|nr:ATP-binding protein [Kistimonas asteriae]